MAAGTDVTQLLLTVVVLAVPVLAAVVCHEVAHGAVAYACGDRTAAEHGRLTLNPLPHIDPIGTVALPGVLLLVAYLTGATPFVFGYARPVPVDYTRLRRPRRDAILVALAGPGTNLLLALGSVIVLGLVGGSPGPVSVRQALAQLAIASLWVNSVLVVFNLLPIPPLDGGRVLAALLPRRSARVLASLEGVGLLVALLLWTNSNLAARVVGPLVSSLLGLVG